MENNRKPPMPGPYYPPFSAGLVGPVSDDVYAAMLDAREQAEAAETAQGKAEDAQEAAEEAQGKAEDAQEAAEEAQGKAEDAQEAAETAQAAAESWATGGSGGTASATNNAKYYSEQAAASASTLVPDPTLSEDDQPALASEVGRNLREFNAADLMAGLLTCTTRTNNGITYTWSDGVCTLTGETDAEQGSSHALTDTRAAMPDYIVPGQTYAVKFDTTNTGGSDYKYRLCFSFFNSEDTQVGSTMYLPIGRNITIPEGAAKWTVFLYVAINTTITGTVTFSDPRLMNTSTNEELKEQIDALDDEVDALETALDERIDALEDNAFRKLTSTEAAAIASSTNTEKLTAMPTGTYYSWRGTDLSALVSDSFPQTLTDVGWYTVKCYAAPYSTKVVSVVSRGGGMLCYGYTLTTPDGHLEYFTWSDRSFDTLDGEIDALDTRIDALEANAFRKLTSTEAAAIASSTNTEKLTAMPTGTYYTWTGEELAPLVSASFPATLSDITYYTVKCYACSAVSGTKYVSVESRTGNILCYGFTLTTHLQTFTWSDRSYDGLDARLSRMKGYNADNLLWDLLPKSNNAHNGITYTWVSDGSYEITGASNSSGSVYNLILRSAANGAIPSNIIPGETYYVYYESSNPTQPGWATPDIRFRITCYDSGNTSLGTTYFDGSGTPYTIPVGAVTWTVCINVPASRSFASYPNSKGYIKNIRMLTARSNVDLTNKSNPYDKERPVYVALGASTVIGAVHYYTATSKDTSYHSKYNFPEYAGNMLGLETHNLAVGGTGLLNRTSFNLQNFMDIIYDSNNEALFARAKLITLTVGVGNDSALSDFTVGSWNDYYPYDLEDYHPSGGNGSALIELGATWCGCLNWCIRWLGTHYPKAQLIIMYGGLTENNAIKVALTNGNGDEDPEVPTKIAVTNNWSETSATAHTAFVALAEALNLAYIDLREGETYTPYAADVKDANGDWVLWSTIKDNSNNKKKDVHPNDEGYHIMARQIAGQIAGLFYR